MKTSKHTIETIKFATWNSSFPDDAPTLRLHEIAWMKAGKSFAIELPSTHKLQILYTVNGIGRLRYEGRTYMLEPMKAYFIDRDKPASLISASDDWVFAWMEISGSMSYNIYYYLTRENGLVSYVNNEMSILFKTVYEKAAKGWTQKADVEMSCLLYQITTIMFGANENQKKFSGSIQYIHEHYQEVITLEQLAEASNMSKYHFAHSFHELFGSTPIDYINGFRMEQAQHLLLTTKHPISVVANEVGIGDRSYFAKLFRKYSGYPPHEFRKAFTE